MGVVKDIKILKNESNNTATAIYKIVGSFTPNSRGGTPYYDDERVEKLENFDDTFKFSVPADSQESVQISTGDYVTFKDDTSKQRIFKITSIDDSISLSGIHVKTIFSESVFIDDLRHRIVPKGTFKNSNFKDIMAHILAGSGWYINKADYLGQSKTVTFDGTKTALECLIEVTNEYKGEVDVYAQVNQNSRGASIVSKNFDLVQKRGRKSTGKRYFYGVDIEGIKRTESIEDFYTSIYPIGKDGLTIAKVNGNNNLIYDEEANHTYNGGTEHRRIVMNFDDIDNPTTLLAEARLKLKELNKPKRTYEIDVSSLEETSGYTGENPPWLGDYVTIVDLDMSPELTVLARVIEKRTSDTNIGGNKIILGDYVELVNNTPSVIKELQAKLDNVRADIKDVYRSDIYSTKGTTIRNGVGETTDLIARVYKNGVQIFGKPHQYRWIKYFKDGTYDTAWINDNINVGDTVFNVSILDYVKNATFKVEFLADVYEHTVVDYYRKEIDRMLTEITKISNSDSIIIPFITDTHVATDADYLSHPLEKERVLTHHLDNFIEVSHQMKVDLAVHGGDIVDGKTLKYTNIANLKSAVNTINKSDCPVMYCKGNHDDNALGSNRQVYTGSLKEVVTPDEMRPIIQIDYDKDGIVTNHADNAIYSYYDIPQKDVRVICLDMWDLRYDLVKQAVTNKTTGEKGLVNLYPSNKFGAFQNKQIQWLINVLMSTPPNTKVIFFGHSGLKSVFEKEDNIINNEIVTGIINSFIDGAHFTNTGTNKDYPTTVDADFRTRGKGKVIAAFAGHKHLDTAKRQGLGNVPTILTTCNVAPLDKNNYSRSINTPFEDAFDVIVINPSENYKIHMVRFGANSDVRPVRSYESGL